MAILPEPSTDSPDLPPLPPLILLILAHCWDTILAWLSALLERRMLARCRQHPLVQLAQIYDPAPVIRACAAFHHPSGPGAPPAHPVALLVRAEIVRAWRGACSDRQLEHTLTTDLLCRWFVGLPLAAPPPDHTTLSRFHAWLATHQPAALFDHVLATLDHHDPEDPRSTPQIADTFALQTPAAPVSPRVLLAILTGRLARWWIDHVPPDHQAALPPLDLGPLLDPPRLRAPSQRPAAIHATATCASWVLAELTPALAALPATLRDRAQAQITRLDHVLTSEFRQDASGTWSARPHGQKGAFRPASAHDLDATFRDHGRTPPTLGYNAAISTTPTRIRSAVAVTGSTPDSATLIPLLAQHQQRGDPLPAHLIMDQAAGHGKTRAQVSAASDGQTQIVAWIPPAGGRDHARFGPADFTLNAAETTCTCPAGVVSSRRYASGAGDGVQFRFTATDCAECPLWDRCRAPDAKPSGHRIVFISAYHGTLRVAATFNRSALGQALLAERWRVEATIAWVVRYAGGRRARRVGTAAAQCQLQQACAVVNLRRWLARIRRGSAPAPPCARGGVCPLAG
jgi:hypothetical protein